MDPYFFPWDHDCLSVAGSKNKSPIRLVRTEHGGHLGYMFHQKDVKINPEDPTKQVSFMPTEMSRFINYVQEQISSPERHVEYDEEYEETESLLQNHELGQEDRIRREKAFMLSSSFIPRDFRPPLQLSNNHLQTISGVFLRDDPDCRYIADKFGMALAVSKGTKLLSCLSKESDTFGDFWDVRQRIDTPDGDFFHVDYKYHSEESNNPSSKGLVVIVHGLQSSSSSPLSVDLGKAYRNKGFDVACINFRGCSGTPNDSMRFYHLGFTDDLKYFLHIINRCELKPPPIYLSGFSLGANVVLKALGELGSFAFQRYNIHGAAVAGAPFDQERNNPMVQRPGFNKLVYNDSLLKSLKKSILSQLERFPDAKEAKLRLSYNEIIEATEISALETAVIAPLFGFQNNVDYYRKTNCINFFDNIQVPTFILNAGDDPFFDPDFFPYEKGCDSPAGKSNLSPIKLVRTEYGGHLGFMFHQRHEDETDLTDISFMPAELARYIDHVSEGRSR
jgi:hypothetical protein